MFLLARTTAPDDPQAAQPPLSTGRKVLFAGIMVLFVLVVIELGLRLFYKPVRAETIDQKLARVSEYGHLDWPRELFTEEKHTKTGFVPWIMWRQKELHSKNLNIDKEGLRKTWNPAVTEGQKVKRVFFFGGSTTLGVGARDDFTVPSLLSKRLNQGAERFVVTNFGVRAFTLRQEVMNLITLLVHGDVPDYAVFYDGINEVLVGWATGKAGLFNQANALGSSIMDAIGKESTEMVKVDPLEFKPFETEEEPVWVTLGHGLQETYLYSAVSELGAWVKRLFAKPRGFSPKKLAELNQLADNVTNDYLENVKFVQRLSQCYGFKCLFIWQPCPFTNKALTAEEKKEPSWKWKNWVELADLVYGRMAKVKTDHWHNISTIFDHKNKTIFISWAHLTEEGNDQVAARIYQIFQQEYGPKVSAELQSPQGQN
jgi:hypothetical protein